MVVTIIRTLLLCIFLVGCFLIDFTDCQGSVLSEALKTSAPNLQQVTNPNLPTSLWGTIKAPYPTNVFWTNLVLGNGYTRINLTPYQIQSDPKGILISMPTMTVSSSFILATFIQDISIQASEITTGHQVRSYDLLSVTLDWGGLQMPLVRGSPYITAIFQNKTPLFNTVHAILSVNGQTTGSIQGSRFEISLNSNQIFIIYTSNPITLSWTSSQLVASAPFSGVVRVAYSSGAQMTAILDQGQNVYPLGGEVTYTTANDVATISFNWDTVGTPSSNLVMTALPHHVDSFVTTSVAMSNAYQSIRGPLSLVVGSVWQMQENLTTIEWFAPNPIDPSKVDEISTALDQDKNIQMVAPDPYFFGKEAARNARLALIADQLNRNDVASSIRESIKPQLISWLTGTNADPLQYDSTWGGICSKNGLADSGADFGNGIYNDHHFHYGYHVYAASVIAKEDPTFLQTYSSNVLDLLRDYVNPSSSDPNFPVTRLKDWYDGNSWASGITIFGDSKNQESTSESINAYYAAYLWGLVSGNTQLKDLGRVMLATEIRAAKKYWHMTTSSSVYPEPFAENKVAGIVWSTKVDYATWFGANVEYIHCIQMLPFTPITESLLPASWIQEEYTVLSTAFTRATPVLTDDWKGYIYMAHAIIDPVTAWNEIHTLTYYDDGNTKTNTLYWVATRQPSQNKKKCQK